MSTGPDKAATADGVLRYRQRMSVESPAHAAAGNSDEKSASFRERWKSPRAIAFVALAIAVIAVGLAIAAWLVPVPKHVSGQQSSQAKLKVCTTYATVFKAVDQGVSTARPEDPAGQEALAANVRLAMIGGSSYLRETLDAEPATPPDLAKAVKSMANTLDQLGFAFLLRADTTVKQQLAQTFKSQVTQVNQICAPNTSKK